MAGTEERSGAAGRLIEVSALPSINACFNTLSATLIAAGWWQIRQGRTRAHAACMIAALASSALFLAGYLYYHAHAGTTRFTAQGWVRPLYFTILLTHTVLAVVIVPLIAATVVQAARRKWESHRRWARWTLPLWLYVSVTGVFVYFFLYHWFPPVVLS